MSGNGWSYIITTACGLLLLALLVAACRGWLRTISLPLVGGSFLLLASLVGAGLSWQGYESGMPGEPVAPFQSGEVTLYASPDSIAEARVTFIQGRIDESDFLVVQAKPTHQKENVPLLVQLQGSAHLSEVHSNLRVMTVDYRGYDDIYPNSAITPIVLPDYAPAQLVVTPIDARDSPSAWPLFGERPETQAHIAKQDNSSDPSRSASRFSTASC